MSDCNCCETKQCVSCDVKNCIHNTADNTCAAGKIQVGHGIVSGCKETCCDTFQAK